MTPTSLSRRSFLTTTTLAAVAAPLLISPASAADCAAWQAGRTVGGFFVGPQAWSFKQFSAMEAIEMAGRAGATVIEFFPGQKFSVEKPDLKWDHNASEEQAKAIADQLAKWKITPMNYGVTGISKDEKEARKIFDFAKRWGLYGVTTESADAIDTLDKLAQEYGIRVCFHNHPQKKDDPGYKVWNPEYILGLTKDRSPLVGACADTGHWQRSGLDPLAAIKLLKGRVLATHFKDRTDIAGPDVPFGTGKSPVVAMLEELHSQGFKGNVSIEYETNWDHNLSDVAQCVGYLRALGSAKGWS
jgi:sugar phosphate isomerase/epimerase